MNFHLCENKSPAMFNFTKKNGDSLMGANQEANGVSEKYQAALKQIECLEGQLNQKILELSQSCKAQLIMSEGIKKCEVSLYIVQKQIQTVAAHLNQSNKYILELIQKNSALKLSCDEWFRRAIKLEFDVLTARDKLAKIEQERDLAVKMCERLQVDLVSAVTEKPQGGIK